VARRLHRCNPPGQHRFTCIGEIWTDSETVSSYVPDSVDLAFEFELADEFLSSMKAWNATDIAEAPKAVSSFYSTGQFAPFLTNHDQDRVMSQLGGNVERAHIAAVWLLTAEGVPFVYYGEEVGLAGTKPDERIRTPMPWSDGSIRVGFTTGIPWEPLISLSLRRTCWCRQTMPTPCCPRTAI
jgi:alpha-amylase